MNQSEVNTATTDMVALVEHWMKSFEVQSNYDLQLTIVEEEVNEFYEAFVAAVASAEPEQEALANVLKETADVLFTLIGLGIMVRAGDELTPEQADKIGELSTPFMLDIQNLEVLLPGFLKLADQSLIRVIESNMTKLGDDGKPVRREDGKVLKGPNYKAPDLSDLAAILMATANEVVTAE